MKYLVWFVVGICLVYYYLIGISCIICFFYLPFSRENICTLLAGIIHLIVGVFATKDFLFLWRWTKEINNEN